MNYQPTVNRKQCKKLCRRVLAANTMENAIEILDRWAKRLPDKRKRGSWGYYAKRMVAAFRVDETPFQIFKMDGNTKLPFAAFSALPEFTCPGAGECLNFCYSFTAWRYPAAFLRQLQNTLLLIHAPHVVADAFQRLPADIDVRLYVDGDFESVERVAFWMENIVKRADLSVYGYSKSWAHLLEFHLNGNSWPANYTLNLSSGSKYSDSYKAPMSQLPITRGEFVAVGINETGLPGGFKRYDSPEYHNRVRAKLRETYGKRVVSCGGKCGECGAGKHWCGDRDKLDKVVIGIGVH